MATASDAVSMPRDGFPGRSLSRPLYAVDYCYEREIYLRSLSTLPVGWIWTATSSVITIRFMEKMMHRVSSSGEASADPFLLNG